MRTTVDLDPALLRRLRVEARRRGVSVKALLAAAVQRGLDHSPGAEQPYRCPTFSLGAPQPGVNLDKALALASALEDDEALRDLIERK